jgi:hypothetical protein
MANDNSKQPAQEMKCDNCGKNERDQAIVENAISNEKWCLDCMRLAGLCISCSTDIIEQVEDYFMYDKDECPTCNTSSI